MKKILTVILFFVSFVVFGQTTYYVSNSGDDASADPTNPATPWKTIAKVTTWGLASNYDPGDSVRFKCGDVWEEQLVIPQSGGAGSPITFTSYGTGDKPIITGKDDVTGWDVAGNWTSEGGNVWSITLSYSSAVRLRVWLNGTEAESASSAALVSNLLPHYHNQAVTKLYIYSPAPQTPATYYTSIERGGSRATAIDVVTKSNLTFSNLDLQGATYGIRLIAAGNIIIQDCDIGMGVNRTGIYFSYVSPFTESSNVTIRRNTVDSGLRFFYDWIYTDPYFNLEGILVRSVDGCLIYDNDIIDWNHSGLTFESFETIEAQLTDVQAYDNYITCPSLSYGHGCGAFVLTGYGSGIKMFRNLIYDTAVRSQFVADGFEFYYNVINIVRGCEAHPNAVGQGIYPTGSGDGNPINMKIYNNVVANCDDEGLQMYGSAGDDRTGNEIINNIFYNNDATDNYQLYISDHATIYSNIIKNNIFYKSGVSAPVYYMGSAMTVAEFNAENGTNGDEISNNDGGSPMFKAGTFELSILSTNAINKGIDVGLTTDYFERLIDGLPDIGYAEWYSDETPVTGNAFGISTDSTYFLKNSNGQFLIFPR